MKFTFSKAQEFELNWQRNYISKVFNQEMDKWKERVENNQTDNHIMHFAPHSIDGYIEHIKDKSGLDVGCGSIPLIKEINVKNKAVLDPLAGDYDRIEKELFGKSFFDGIKIYSERAEVVIPELVDSIDGVIVFRNALDHSEDPLMLLNTISSYAKSGCYFLFWSDIWHYDGGNDGHRNITKSSEVMDKLIASLGFQKIANSKSIRNPKDFIDYGGVFIKR